MVSMAAYSPLWANYFCDKQGIAALFGIWPGNVPTQTTNADHVVGGNLVLHAVVPDVQHSSVTHAFIFVSGLCPFNVQKDSVTGALAGTTVRDTSFPILQVD